MTSTSTPVINTPVNPTFLKAGYCTHPEAITLKGGQWSSVQFPNLFVLIRHPTLGNILYDTGYSERFFQATEHFPNRLYALLTPVYLQPEEAALQQLQQHGIAPESIKYIFISHFHADHISGLADFPDAVFVCARSAYDALKHKSGIRALKEGFLPELLPADFEQRVQYVEASPAVSPFPGLFETGWDVFGDRSLIAVLLPGHATGQLGLLFTDTQQQQYFLVADACWSSQAYQELVQPSAIANLLFSNPSDYKRTLEKLHQLHQQQPYLRILPTHCGQIFEQKGTVSTEAPSTSGKTPLTTP